MVLHETIVRPRVALILPNLGGGGAERVALALAGHFVDAGDEVDIVLLGRGGELRPLVPEGAQVIEFGAKRLKSALIPLVRYFRSRRPDAVQAFMWPVSVLAIIAHRLAGRPGRLAISDHGTLSKQYGPRSPLLKATTSLFYRAADERICVSAGVADDLAKLSGLKRDSIEVIQNPVLLPASVPQSSGQVEGLWPAGSRRILTVGNLKPEKNHKLLIESFASVSKHESAALMILGEGPQRSELEALVAALDLQDRVSMPGFFVDPWPFYRSADLFVLSSDHEGYPLVLVEALAAGLPIVSTDSGSGPREILSGGFGQVTPVGNASALAGAIRTALTQTRNQDMLRRRAAELVEGACAAHEQAMFGESRQ